MSGWRAAALVERSIDYLWQAVAGLFVTFTRTPMVQAAAPGPVPDRRRLIESALDSRDEHAIKVVEAALVEESISGGGLVACAAEFACHRIRAMR